VIISIPTERLGAAQRKSRQEKPSTTGREKIAAKPLDRRLPDEFRDTTLQKVRANHKYLAGRAGKRARVGQGCWRKSPDDGGVCSGVKVAEPSMRKSLTDRARK
jgi:hypothetical protein